MKRELKIEVRHPQISCRLLIDGKELDRESWDDGNDTSQELLSRIEKLLKRQHLVVQDLDKVSSQSDQESYTTSRIIRVTVEALNFCLKEE